MLNDEERMKLADRIRDMFDEEHEKGIDICCEDVAVVVGFVMFRLGVDSAVGE